MIALTKLTAATIGESTIGSASAGWNGFLCSPASANMFITIPRASRMTGRLLTFITDSLGAYFVRLVPTSTELFYLYGFSTGQVNLTALDSYSSVTLWSTGTKWIVVYRDGGFSPPA